MEYYTIHKAKTQLSKILEKVEKGEEVIISRGNEPVAIIKKYEAPQKSRKGGQWRGKVWMADDFDDFGEDLKQLFGIKE